MWLERGVPKPLRLEIKLASRSNRLLVGRPTNPTHVPAPVEYQDQNPYGNPDAPCDYAQQEVKDVIDAISLMKSLLSTNSARPARLLHSHLGASFFRCSLHREHRGVSCWMIRRANTLGPFLPKMLRDLFPVELQHSSTHGSRHGVSAGNVSLTPGGDDFGLRGSLSQLASQAR